MKTGMEKCNYCGKELGDITVHRDILIDYPEDTFCSGSCMIQYERENGKSVKQDLIQRWKDTLPEKVDKINKKFGI